MLLYSKTALTQSFCLGTGSSRQYPGAKEAPHEAASQEAALRGTGPDHPGYSCAAGSPRGASPVCPTQTRDTNLAHTGPP